MIILSYRGHMFSASVRVNRSK